MLVRRRLAVVGAVGSVVVVVQIPGADCLGMVQLTALRVDDKRQAPDRRSTGEFQRNSIVCSTEPGRKAEEALIKAADVLADHTPGRRPDNELARA